MSVCLGPLVCLYVCLPVGLSLSVCLSGSTLGSHFVQYLEWVLVEHVSSKFNCETALEGYFVRYFTVATYRTWIFETQHSTADPSGRPFCTVFHGGSPIERGSSKFNCGAPLGGHFVRYFTMVAYRTWILKIQLRDPSGRPFCKVIHGGLP